VPVLVLDLLKYLFIIVLYIFMARAVRAIYLELKPDRGASAPAQPVAKSSKKGKAPRKAVVVEGDKLKGKSFDLSHELVIGRGEKCHINLGSTNGTYLNRKRVSAPSELQRGDKVKIGRTVMELRK
jgi:hypothetical protein